MSYMLSSLRNAFVVTRPYRLEGLRFQRIVRSNGQLPNRREQQHRCLASKHPNGFKPPSREDLDELRESVREFTRREISETVADETDKSNAFPMTMWPKLGSAGLLGPTADERFGGLGLGYQAHCIIMDELSRASGSIALSYAAHSQLCVNQLSLNGSEDQKTKFLPSLIAGKQIGALAMSEHGAGSDVVSMRTTATPATRNGQEGYELNGGKMWITNGPDADIVVVYAKTDLKAQPASRGISAFIVSTKSEGFMVTRKLDKLGMRGSNTGELNFENVFVPKEDMLGPVNGGVRVLMEGLDLERLVLSAGPIGIMQRALDEALPYVHTRQQFGQPISKMQLVQGKLADMYVALQSSRAWTMSVAAAIDSGHAELSSGEGAGISSRDCTGAILLAAENATKVALDAVQLLGGMGYVNEVPVGRLVRDAKLYEIGAGTSEVRRLVVGRSFEREYGGGK
ncbi:MAG: hypothetical protein Q9162_001987 [Coniocarpon cinnabarinum]